MKLLRNIALVLLFSLCLVGCKKEENGNAMSIELKCNAENNYMWQTTIHNSNVIKSESDKILYKDQDNVLETKQIITFNAYEEGNAEIQLEYINTKQEDKNKKYSLKYIVEVDKDLKIKVLSKSGNYYGEEAPNPKLYFDYSKKNNLEIN